MADETPAAAEPVPGDGFVDIPTGVSMPDVAQLSEPGNLSVAFTAMANAAAGANGILSQAFAASAHRRTDAADQLAADSGRMWSVFMTTPSVNAGLGYRTATESGAGRTRAETNAPYETSAGGKQ